MEIILVCGHYGCGKTNFSINLALSLAAQNKRVVIADMDIVNPYFRTSDYKTRLQQSGVEVISPVFAGTTVDAPCLSAAVYSVFDRIGTSEEPDCAIFDIGGDDAGATCVAQYSKMITEHGYEMLYVINRYREQIADADGAKATLTEIENACGIKATAIVNNSHLCEQTSVEDIKRSFVYADEVSKATGLPVKYTSVEMSLAHFFGTRNDVFSVERIVLPDWGRVSS